MKLVLAIAILGTVQASCQGKNCNKPLVASNEPVKCDANTYYWGQFKGSNYCVKCPKDTVSKACTNCKIDKSGSSCKPIFSDVTCPRGKFVLNDKCQTCPAGKWQSQKTQNTCFKCPVGMFQPKAGFYSCYSCPRGKFQGTAGSTVCNTCAGCKGGKFGYTPNTKSTTSATCKCLSCAPGRFTVKGHTACYDCPLGRHNAMDGSSTCQYCAAGKFTQGSGRTECTACASGKWSHQGAQTSKDCTVSSQSKYRCAAGRYIFYWAKAKTLYCLYCPTGRFGVIKPNYDYGGICKNCVAGKFQAYEGKTTCTKCAAKTSSTTGSSSCKITMSPTNFPTMAPTKAPTPKPYHCIVSKWAKWSACSRSCGQGVKWRRRVVIQFDKNGGSRCPALKSGAVVCNNFACPKTPSPTNRPTLKPTAAPTRKPTATPTQKPTRKAVHCTVGKWGRWSDCTKTCGKGYQISVRRVISHRANGGYVCPSLEKQKVCLKKACPTASPTNFPTRRPTRPPTNRPTNEPTKMPTLGAVHCAVSGWSKFSKCSKTCNGGKQSRSRYVVRHARHGGYVCPPLKETIQCNKDLCTAPPTPAPVDCETSNWKVSKACPKNACGPNKNVFTYYTRTVTRHPHSGGKVCPGLQRRIKCGGPCPVHCSFYYKKATACSKSCGDGTQTRKLKITKQSNHGGSVCPSKNIISPCNLKSCPIHCVVTGWKSWSRCSNSCGTSGSSHRFRKVQTTAAYGGIACPKLAQTKKCNRFKCPINCKLAPVFNAYSACSKSCGNGIKTATRGVVRNAYYGGKKCSKAAMTKTRKCFTACPIHCAVSQFGAWGKCSVSCGTGAHSSTRTVVTKPQFGGVLCPALRRTKNCNSNSCPVDCKLGSWTKYSKCTKSCGRGIQHKTRSAINWAASGGKACGTMSAARACNSQACPLDCFMSVWDAWGTCGKSCGASLRYRKRSIMHKAANGGVPCGKTTASAKCNDGPCPQHCTTTGWSAWADSKCSKSCGGGLRSRSRKILTKALFGGFTCPHLIETAPCGTKACPIDCRVTNFGIASLCTKTCGGGKSTKTRRVLSYGMFGGKACPALTKTTNCASQRCPVNCKLTAWNAKYCACSKSCGGGVQSNRRSISVAAAYGGRACTTLVRSRTCGTQTCPIDCKMSKFSQWSRCSRTCGTGVKTMTRQIIIPNQSGGKFCGALTKTASCNTHGCPVNCQLSAWDKYNKCSKSCGGGVQSRMRSVARAVEYGGVKCAPLSQARVCNSNVCAVNCVVSKWSAFSSCTHSCGSAGMMQKVRSIVTYGAFGGKTCPSIVFKSKCNRGSCPVHCVVSKWGKYSKCTKTCGGGRMTRTRTVSVASAAKGRVCPSLKSSEVCGMRKCPVDCVHIKVWTKYSACTKTCGGGVQSKQRSVITQASAGGKACQKKAIFSERLCNVQKCAIDCVQSQWSAFSKCTATCGKGTKLHRRSTKVAAAFGGKACGATTETKACAWNKCPINCKYSAFGKWTVCNKSCGKGGMFRYRSILKNGLFGGKACKEGAKVRYQMCNTKPCPVPCIPVSHWFEWSKCTKTCGNGGTQSRIREIKAAKFGGACDFAASEKRACSHGPCAVHCRVGKWGKYTKCTKSCGGGIQHQFRKILQSNKHNGKICPPLSNSLVCNKNACPVHCQQSLWSDWTRCSTSCGGGRRSRTRKMIVAPSSNGKACGKWFEGKACNTRPCPIDCVMGGWTKYSQCTVTCNRGKQAQSRIVTQSAAYGGKRCPTNVRSRACAVFACPVDCQLSGWKSWGACTATCGGGIQYRFKNVDVHPFASGKDCGATKQTRKCSVAKCPVDCLVSAWSNQWTGCTKSCGTGTQWDTRSIIRAASAWGGKACPITRKTRSCNSHPCPIDCAVGKWGLYSKCSKTCGLGGSQARTRKVVTATKYGGATCASLKATRACFGGKCPIHCTVGKWTKWSKCTKSCAGGVTRRNRKVVNQDRHGGRVCPSLAQAQKCSTKPCPVDCKVSAWDSKSKCTKKCGGGVLTQFRRVSVVPRNSGNPCPTLQRQVMCNKTPCPVACVVEWTKTWSQCSKSCDEGIQKKYAHVTVQAMYGGKKCPHTTKSRFCNTHLCTDKPTPTPTLKPTATPTAAPTFGQTASPTPRTTCMPGSKFTKVMAVNGADTGGEFALPASGPWAMVVTGSKYCVGLLKMGPTSANWAVDSVGRKNGKYSFTYLNRNAFFNFPLNGAHKCSVVLTGVCTGKTANCKVSKFGKYGKCSKSCGGGVQVSRRTMLMRAQHGGKCAPEMTLSRKCQEQQCPWSKKYQAEDAFLKNGAQFQTSVKGYSGNGYVRFEKPKNEQIYWTVEAPHNGRYKVSFRYSTPKGQRSTGLNVITRELLDVNHKFQEIVAFPRTQNNKWATTSMVVDLHKGKNMIKLITATKYGPHLDSITISHQKNLARCTPGKSITLNWAASATTGRNAFKLTKGRMYPKTASTQLAGYIDLKALGPWHIHTAVTSSGANKRNKASYVDAYINGQKVGRYSNNKANHVQDSATEIKTGSVQYRFDFESYTNVWQYHISVASGKAVCGGCSHVTCKYEKHIKSGKVRIAVHHSRKERYGNQHKCAFSRAWGQCQCTCTQVNKGHNPWAIELKSIKHTPYTIKPVDAVHQSNRKWQIKKGGKWVMNSFNTQH